MKDCPFKEGQLVKCTTKTCPDLKFGCFYVVKCMFNNVGMNVTDSLYFDVNDYVYRSNIIIDVFSFYFTAATEDEIENYVKIRKSILEKKLKDLENCFDTLKGI